MLETAKAAVRERYTDMAKPLGLDDGKHQDIQPAEQTRLIAIARAQIGRLPGRKILRARRGGSEGAVGCKESTHRSR
jgi:hypothetical protein